MLGPKVIRDESLDRYIEEQRAAASLRPRTGIRRTNTGGWAAIREDRLVDTFEGPGSKGRAILSAGTNAVIA